MIVISFFSIKLKSLVAKTQKLWPIIMQINTHGVMQNRSIVSCDHSIEFGTIFFY